MSSNSMMERKDKIKDYNHKYYSNHKSKWYMPHRCECGGKYVLANKPKHMMTKRHQMYLINSQIEPLEEILHLKLFP